MQYFVPIKFIPGNNKHVTKLKVEASSYELDNFDPVNLKLSFYDKPHRNMPDFVPILILLFLFSQVSERLGNVIKLHIVDRFIPNVPNDPLLEIKKEKKTIITSLVSGFIISFVFEVYDSTFESLNFLQDKDRHFLAAAARIALGTLLLAFGSKFWHDILDVIFYYKKIKQLTAGGEIFKIDEVKLLEEHVELHGSELARRCMEQNAVLLNKIPNSTYGIMPKSNKGKIEYGITIYSESESDVNALPLPSSLSYRSHSGTLYHVPVECIVTGVTTTQETFNKARAGDAIANAASPKKKGTFGCLMKHKNSVTGKDDFVIVTCYHVVKIAGMAWEGFHPTPDLEATIVAVGEGAAKPIGKITKGERTRYHDIALIKPTQITAVENIVYQSVTIPYKHRKVTAADVENKIEVRFRGINSPSDRVAKLVAREFPERIKYGDEQDKHLLSGLLVISTSVNDYKNPSAGGDSGAILYDEDNYAIGMIVAGNKKFGYAIPFSEIVDQYNLKPITS